MARNNNPSLVVGFAAEARVAHLSGWPVAIGGGTTEGAAQVVRRLIEAGATGIVSFGLAGGLDPDLPAGSLIVADSVTAYGRVWQTDPYLNARLGGSTGHLCLGLDRVVVSRGEKQRLSRETGACMVDMESGAVAAVAAALGVPFAVLRAICDPADRSLPPAAMVALDTVGRLSAARIAMSVMARPGQLGELFGLARDAASARRALRVRAMQMAPSGLISRPPERMPPDRTLPVGMSDGRVPVGMSPGGMSPDGMLPDAMSPDGMSPDAMLPDRMIPERMLTEGIL